MAEFTKEELLKVAKLSALNLSPNEIDTFVTQLKNVIAYVDQLKAVTVTQQAASNKNVNVMRDDVVTPFPCTSPLELAPQQQDNYFVVPKILDEK